MTLLFAFQYLQPQTYSSTIDYILETTLACVLALKPQRFYPWMNATEIILHSVLFFWLITIENLLLNVFFLLNATGTLIIWRIVTEEFFLMEWQLIALRIS
jgi:hypothetical protein